MRPLQITMGTPWDDVSPQATGGKHLLVFYTCVLCTAFAHVSTHVSEPGMHTYLHAYLKQACARISTCSYCALLYYS